MILIVDDYPDGATALRLLLRYRGYPCEWVPDGAAALAHLGAHASERPLLVVLDENMPDMQGLDVLRHMRSDPALADVAVILFSSEFDPAKRDAALALGAADWLVKAGTSHAPFADVLDTMCHC